MTIDVEQSSLPDQITYRCEAGEVLWKRWRNSLSLSDSRVWRNWQTRMVQVHVGDNPVEVRFLSPALFSHFLARLTVNLVGPGVRFTDRVATLPKLSLLVLVYNREPL